MPESINTRPDKTRRKLVVSVVTPSFNQAEFLESTIRSVLTQTYPHIEYMVCDGGSKDGSLDVLERHADHLAWWCSERDRGQSDAINKGWQRATGDILAYLNSDDVLLPGAVEQVVDTFQEHPSASVVYGDWEYLDEHGAVLGLGKGRPTNFDLLLRDGQSRYIAQPASFYRSSALRAIGFIDESLHYSMDYDLLLRLAQQGSMVHIPVRLAGYRVHVNAKTTEFAERHWRETLAVSKRYGAGHLSKLRFLYWRYRVLAAAPTAIQILFRRARNASKDWTTLQSATNRRKEK